MNKIERAAKYNPEKAKQLQLELDTLAMRSRITRLDMLKSQINAEIGIKTLKDEGAISKGFKDVFNTSYNNIQSDFKTNGIRANGKLAKDFVDNLIKYPWSGSNFSDNLWGTKKEKLVELLGKHITQGSIQGLDVNKITEKIRKELDSDFKVTQNVVRTELNYALGQSNLAAYKDDKIEEYEMIGCSDNRTCDLCSDLDGKKFKVKDATVGQNYHPLHPRCRCTSAPVVDRSWINDVTPENNPDTNPNFFEERELTGDDSGGILVKRDYESSLAKITGKEFYNTIMDIVENCSVEQVKNFYVQKINDVTIADINAKSGSINPKTGHVSLNLEKTKSGSSYQNSNQVAFHEIAHAQDWNVAREKGLSIDKTCYSAYYKDSIFPKTIEAEVAGHIKTGAEIAKRYNYDYIKMGKEGHIRMEDVELLYEVGSKRAKEIVGEKVLIKKVIGLSENDLNTRAVISDIINGATKGRVKLGVGHPDSYWKTFTKDEINTGLSMEATADISEAVMANSKALNLVKIVIPKSYEVYLEMVEDMVK